MSYWKEIKAWLMEIGLWAKLEALGLITPNGYIDREQVLNPEAIDELDAAWFDPAKREIKQKYFTLLIDERSEQYGKEKTRPRKRQMRLW